MIGRKAIPVLAIISMSDGQRFYMIRVTPWTAFWFNFWDILTRPSGLVTWLRWRRLDPGGRRMAAIQRAIKTARTAISAPPKDCMEQYRDHAMRSHETLGDGTHDGPPSSCPKCNPRP